MVLHLPYLDPQTPPVVRRWHFYLDPQMICGRQKLLEPPLPVGGQRIAVTPQAAPMGSQLGGQPGTVSDLVFPKANGQICLLRGCRTATRIAITTGEH